MFDIILEQPVYLYSISAFILLTLALIITRFIRRSIFKKRVIFTADHATRITFGEKRVLRNSTIIEKVIEKKGTDFLETSGIGDIWIKDLRLHSNKRTFNLILKYYQENGLFLCFLAGIKKDNLFRSFKEAFKSEDDILVVEKMAHSCQGEPFEKEKAFEMLKGNLNIIRELSGSPDWNVRYFCYSILIFDTEKSSERILEKGLKDCHPNNRELLLVNYKYKDKESFYQILKSALLDDPVFSIRRKAKLIILTRFKELYELNIDDYTLSQQMHILEQLDPTSEKDISIAMDILEKEDGELLYSASQFLMNIGWLNKLLDEADSSDQGDLERRYNLLRQAASVGFQSFLAELDDNSSEGALLLAAKLLRDVGDNIWLDPLVDLVLHRDPFGHDYSYEILKTTLEALSAKSTDYSARVAAVQMVKLSTEEPRLFELFIENIPKDRENYFFNELITCLNDISFPYSDVLISKISLISKSLLLPSLIDILKDDSADPVIKQRALPIIADLQQPYTLQTILEFLPVLSIDDAENFHNRLNFFEGKVFTEKVSELLNSNDAALKAVLFAALPQKSALKMIDQLEAGLGDVDADVRIGALKTIFRLNRFKVDEQSLQLLRDPVFRVRAAAAKLFVEYGEDDALDALDKLLKDNTEASTVKEAAILALKYSNNCKSADILVAILDEQDEYRDLVKDVLIDNVHSETLKGLIDNFKDGTPELRELIVEVFIGKSRAIEETLKSLLELDIQSIKPYLIDVLEKSGFIEAQISLLSDPVPEVRRNVTEFLGKLGTKGAIRGIVLASRDPDQQVRVNVTKALEKLTSSEGRSLLEELLNDPDKRVRDYTHWALERYDIKNPKA